MHYEGDNMMGVKRTNRSAALRVLHERGNISRKRLAESIKLTPAAITKIVGEMIAEGLLAEGSTIPSGGAGRREVMVEMKTRSKCALGVLVSAGRAVLSAVWLDGSCIFSENLELPLPAPAQETIKMLSDRLMALVEEHSLPREKIVGLGLAMRGVISPCEKVLINSYGTFDTDNLRVCELFEEYTHLPTVLTSNIRAIFTAQKFLAREHSLQSQFFIRCENGIVAAMSVDGKIVNGFSQQCAEIGHIPVVRRGGKPCVCGKCGCLETIASPNAIMEDALAIMSKENTPVLWKMSQSKGAEAISLENILDAARFGDNAVAEIVDRAVFTMAAALKAVIYIVDPGKIVLYGRMFEYPYYLTKLMAELSEGVDANHNVSIEKSRFNCQLDSVAAGILAVEDFFNRGGTMASL